MNERKNEEDYEDVIVLVLLFFFTRDKRLDTVHNAEETDESFSSC